MDLATACSKAKGTNSAVTGLSRGCCPKIRSSATHQRCFLSEQIAFLSVLSFVDRRGSLNSPQSGVGNGGGPGGIRHHPLSRRQPEPAHDIFEDHPAGRAAALAKVVTEPACQQASAGGRSAPHRAPTDQKKALKTLKSSIFRDSILTRPGLEPGKAEPKSAVLPLHHRVTNSPSAASVVSQTHASFLQLLANLVQ